MNDPFSNLYVWVVVVAPAVVFAAWAINAAITWVLDGSDAQERVQ